MLGKIANLVTSPLRTGFEVSYGVSFNYAGIADLDFAKLLLLYSRSKKKRYIIHCRGIYRLFSSRYNELTVANITNVDKLNKGEVENRLWVIIPYSSEIITTTANKIVHTFSNQALLEMKVEDIVTVSRIGEKPETYMAVQAGNEILLVKKTR